MQARVNRFHDIEIKSSTLPYDVERFRSEMRQRLIQWTREKMNAVWLKIPLSRVELLPIAQKEFDFQCNHVNAHHYMMTLWLPNSPSKLTPCGTHNVGVSVLLLRPDTQQVLLVKERYYNQQRLWKLISGSVELNEFVHECVEREVLEETGMRCNYRGILGFWNRKNVKFGKSELHFCAYAELDPSCYAKPIKPQEDEIYSAQWFTLDKIQTLRLDEQFIERQWFSQFYAMRKTDPEQSPFLHLQQTRDFRNNHCMVYHMRHDEKVAQPEKSTV